MATALMNETFRFDQKKTIAAHERQIQNLQQLLTLQTNETTHCQDHILILNREVDTLRKIIDEKQKSIHDLQRQLRKKQDFSTELEKKYDESKIDKLAFFELEERNLQLLEALKEKQAELEKLQIENRYLQEHRDDRLLLEEIKSKKALELEITFPFERTQLQVRLDHAQEINNQQAMRMQVLDHQVQELTQKLHDSQDRMKDLLLRSKQSEFKMLMELDAKDIENHALDFQNHQMKLTQQSLTSQTDELTAQLNNSVQQTETLQTLFSSAIHTLEHDVHQLHTKEKMLLRENQLLQYEGQIQKDVIARASTAISETMNLQAKREKKRRGSKINPLSLSATLPTMTNSNLVDTATSNNNGSRPSSATISNKANNSMKQRASTSHKGASKRHPLNKFEDGVDRSRTSTADSAVFEGANHSNSRLTTALPKFHQVSLSMSSPSSHSHATAPTTANENRNNIDPILSAFSPAITGGLATQQDVSLKEFLWTLPPVTTPIPPTTSDQSLQRLPQHEIVTVDLKNTMLHRFMQMICRSYEAVAHVEKLLAELSTLKKQNQSFKSKSSLHDDDITAIANDEYGYPNFEEKDSFITSLDQPASANTATKSGASAASYWNHSNSNMQNPFVSLGIVEEINLNNCSLVDNDLNAVIDWLRTVPTPSLLPHLHAISFQHNTLTGDALLKLFAWISSFSMDEWNNITDRGSPLEIDFKYNNIVYESIVDVIKYMRKFNNPDIAYISLVEESKERKIMFHVKSRTHKQGSCIALIMDINKQRGDHKNRLLRQSLSSSLLLQQQQQQAQEHSNSPQKSAAVSPTTLSFRDPIVSKIQTFTSESVYPILQTAGLISNAHSSSSFSPSKHMKQSLRSVDQVDEDNFALKEANTIPRDLIMKYDYIGAK